MNKRNPKLVALLYNEQINTRNLEGVIALMAENHKFIDTKNMIENREQMKKSQEEFFTKYAD